jgi:malate synthase
MARAQITTPLPPGGEAVLTEAALQFLADLHEQFAARRDDLLDARAQRRLTIARTGRLDFLPETAHIREDGTWRVAAAPPDLLDRRVEITGPTEPKMAINAMNSGARVWLADLEDANTPHWHNVVGGQLVLRDAALGTLTHETPEKTYTLRTDSPLALPLVRPRGWHLPEAHVILDGEPAVAALVDFGLHFFTNAHTLLARGSAPYYYLPKMESHREAQLWQDVFTAAQAALGIPYGSIRATVLIETIPAAFEMDEILYVLRDHAAGLNAGRWDYLFSIIKNFRDCGPDFVLPDRNTVRMTAPFLRAYSELLVRTCHARDAHAIGGMSAFIPNRRDPAVTARALEQVRADKLREAGDGFDGSWVAHPDLVPVCQEVFDDVLGDEPHQKEMRRHDVHVTAGELLDVRSAGHVRTLDGLRDSVDVAVRYLAVWLGGNGAVAINNLMEDAATAEISRSQVWQWVHNSVTLDKGITVTRELVHTILDETVLGATAAGLDPRLVNRAATLFERVALADDYVDFLTLPAYEMIR